MTVSIPTADHHAPAGRGDARAAVWWLAGALLLAGGLGVGAVVSDMGASRTGELGLDVSLSHHRDALLTWLADAVTVVLGPVVAPLLLVALTALVWRRHRPAAITLCAATVVGWLSVGVGKLLFQRARPPYDTVHALALEAGSDGFPSGHAAFAFALLFGVVLALRVASRPTRHAWMIGAPLALAVAMSRVYAGVHYLGDVLAAPLFAGGAVACLVGLWLVLPRGSRSSWTRHLFTVRATRRSDAPTTGP